MNKVLILNGMSSHFIDIADRLSAIAFVQQFDYIQGT